MLVSSVLVATLAFATAPQDPVVLEGTDAHKEYLAWRDRVLAQPCFPIRCSYAFSGDYRFPPEEFADRPLEFGLTANGSLQYADSGRVRLDGKVVIDMQDLGRMAGEFVFVASEGKAYAWGRATEMTMLDEVGAPGDLEDMHGALVFSLEPFDGFLGRVQGALKEQGLVAEDTPKTLLDRPFLELLHPVVMTHASLQQLEAVRLEIDGKHLHAALRIDPTQLRKMMSVVAEQEGLSEEETEEISDVVSALVTKLEMQLRAELESGIPESFSVEMSFPVSLFDPEAEPGAAIDFRAEFRVSDVERDPEFAAGTFRPSKAWKPFDLDPLLPMILAELERGLSSGVGDDDYEF